MSKFLPIIQPTLPPFQDAVADLKAVWESGMLTTHVNVRELERVVAEYTGAPHVVALGNCTAGLTMMFRAEGIEGPGEVILPSFTFAATAHAVVWNGFTPRFVECDPETFNIDTAAVRAAVGPNTRAIVGVHVFGLPCDIDELQAIADDAGVPLFFDSAQGLGAEYKGTRVGGFGRCEVFSMSPTKVVTAAEGGLLCTTDEAFAGRMRQLRDYGKALNGMDMEFVGLNGRMSELHAVVGRYAMAHADEYIAHRTALIDFYTQALGDLPGVRFQTIPADRTRSGNYMVLRIGDDSPVSRDDLYAFLGEQQIQTKKYFWPPVHQQTAFVRRFGATSLPVTEKASNSGLAVPLYGHMAKEDAEHVVAAIRGRFGA